MDRQEKAPQTCDCILKLLSHVWGKRCENSVMAPVSEGAVDKHSFIVETFSRVIVFARTQTFVAPLSDMQLFPYASSRCLRAQEATRITRKAIAWRDSKTVDSLVSIKHDTLGVTCVATTTPQLSSCITWIKYKELRPRDITSYVHIRGG